MQGFFRKYYFASESEDLGRKRKIRDWMGVCEKATVRSRRPGSEMFEKRIPGTVWVIGIKQSGRIFDQYRVGGSDQAIREQLGKQKTRDQVGV